MVVKKDIFNSAIVLLTVFLFISCESNFKDVQKINALQFAPSAEADSINLKYTDSGRIKSILISPRMIDYAAVEFPFKEFPKGIDVTVYDNKGKRTFIKSDYALSYESTKIIDLRKNVTITSEAGQVLKTEQLYYDQKNEWFFTEKSFKFTDPKGGSTTGEGIDFKSDFKRINFQKVRGLINKSE